MAHRRKHPTERPIRRLWPLEERDHVQASLFSDTQLAPAAVSAAKELAVRRFAVQVFQVDGARPDEATVIEAARRSNRLVIIEGSKGTAVGSQIARSLSRSQIAIRLLRLSLPKGKGPTGAIVPRIMEACLRNLE